MKKNARTTIGKQIATNVRNWLLGLITVAVIATFTGFGLRNEINEALRAETLKEEVFHLEGDFGATTMSNFETNTDNFIRKQYKRNGDIVMYEIRNGELRCWLEFYSGFRIEITHFGWLIG